MKNNLQYKNGDEKVNKTCGNCGFFDKKKIVCLFGEIPILQLSAKTVGCENWKKNTNGRTKNEKWLKYLEFTSVRNYLSGSINSKKSKISNECSFEEKIQKVNLTNYLRGLEVFLDEYCDFANTPFELIHYYQNLRKTNDTDGLTAFKQNVENYIIWLKNEKGLSGTTAMNYQAHYRGFLKWNDIILKFKNYDEDSEKAIRKAKYSIDYYKEVEMGKKIIGYVKNYNLKMCMKWMLISGLGSKEIFSFKYADLRHLNYDNGMVRIDSSRIKTGVNFTTFIYSEVKELVKKYLEMNKDAEDGDFWMNEEPEKAYHRYEKMFTNAYKNMIEQEYPELKSVKKKVFTFHSYRSIFITICRDLRVPLHIENRFVAHSDDRLTGAYASAKDLESNFKLVQEELFGVRSSDTREEIEKEIVDRFIANILNKGKRQTIFHNFDDNPEDLKDEDIDMRTGYMIQKIIETVKQELLEDKAFIKELKSKF